MTGAVAPRADAPRPRRKARDARPSTTRLLARQLALAVGVDDTDVDRHVELDEMMDGDAPCVYGDEMFNLSDAD